MIKFDLWDLPGQERYDTIRPMYFRGTDLVIISVDLSLDFEVLLRYINHD